MEVPIYHLEQVLRGKQEEAEDFIGPLDLILHLLKKHKIEIQNIPVAHILDQYLDWMSKRQALDMEIASDFVAMAAHLLYIKTRMLLSAQDEEALSEVELLIASLEQRQRQEAHERILLGLPTLARLYEQSRDCFSTPPKVSDKKPPVELLGLEANELLRAMEGMQVRQQRKLPPPVTAFQTVVGREPYPMDQKAEQLRQRFHSDRVLYLDKLLRESESRSELVAVFLVVLELCKSGAILLLEEEGAMILSSLEENTSKGKG